jgi:hypothetical protein
MKKRAAVKGQKQQENPVAMSTAMQQLMLPLLLAMDATKKGLLSFVQQMGMVVLSELLVAEAAQIAGPKGKHVEGRTHHHWGTGTTPVSFGGRHVSLPHPRVRARGKGRGREVSLPSIERLRDGDPMSERVVEQIALGVSTRGYERSLERVDESIETRGASKSNASRALIDATTEKLAQFVSRKLDDVDLVAMFIDGIEFAGHSVLIALGVTIDGTKTPLGIWAGSTENTVVVTELLSNLVARGLRVDASMLFVIDGGKAIRKALRDVFGDRAIVQRCQVHYLESNVIRSICTFFRESPAIYGHPLRITASFNNPAQVRGGRAAPCKCRVSRLRTCPVYAGPFPKFLGTRATYPETISSFDPFRRAFSRDAPDHVGLQIMHLIWSSG